MNIYDLMTDDLSKVKEFEAACEDMLNSRYILADGKIIRILQIVALSTVLQKIIGGALKGFDYAATARKWSSDGEKKTPESEKDHVALVFCILADLDNHKIYLNDFLRNFFWDGDINMAYSSFCSSMIAPFKRYVVGALNQARGEQSGGSNDIYTNGASQQTFDSPQIELPRMNSLDDPILTLQNDEQGKYNTQKISESDSYKDLGLSPQEENYSFDDDGFIYSSQAIRKEQEYNAQTGTNEDNFRLPPDEDNFRLPPNEPTQSYDAHTEEEDNFRLPPEEDEFILPPDEPTYDPETNVYQQNNVYQNQGSFGPLNGDMTSFDRKINNLADAVERYLYESREIKDEYIFACDNIASTARMDKASALKYARYLKNLLGHIPEIMPYIDDVIDELA